MRSLTRIHQIEVTTQCNLACIYCPHKEMQRPKVHMSMDTFKRAIEWVRFYEKVGDNQKELALTGIGEALLHPEFEAMLRYARTFYDGFIHFSTNGILFTDEVAALCRELGIGAYVSMHRPEKGIPAKLIAEEYGILVGTNHAFVDSSIDWAGTVDWHVSAPKTPCRYQADGWGVVLVDGAITTCCMDSEGVNRIGHVRGKINGPKMEPKPLCDSCHLTIEDQTVTK